MVLPEVPTDDLDDEDADSGEVAVDIDFPSTSTSEEAPATVAVLADEACDDDAAEAEDEERNLTDSEKLLHSEGETSMEPVAPSAPMIEDEVSKVELLVQPPMMAQPEVVSSLYPNLQEMRIKESAPVEVVHGPVQTMTPLTRDQLAQFYRVDGEMRLAEAFEREFLARELEENDQCSSHPLYQLLQRYAKARAELSLNKLEFEALRRKCKVLASELWTMREQTFTGTDTCGDGRVLRASYRGR